jgi:hypothetical protein
VLFSDAPLRFNGAMALSVQQILHAHFDDFAATRKLPLDMHRAARRMMACRTAALGGHGK